MNQLITNIVLWLLFTGFVLHFTLLIKMTIDVNEKVKKKTSILSVVIGLKTGMILMNHKKHYPESKVPVFFRVNVFAVLGLLIYATMYMRK